MTFLLLTFSCKESEILVDTRTVVTDRESYNVTYAPSPDPIPLSQDFLLNITVEDLEGKNLFENITVEATADMPAHGHGMPQEPEITQSDSLFIADGFFFQMSGDWEILIYVSEELEDGSTNVEQATFEVTCCQ
jgi:hypothetical protein